MSTRFLKDKIDGLCVQKFQLAYICDTTHPTDKQLVKFCCEVHYLWCGNQDLGLQGWEEFIKSNKI